MFKPIAITTILCLALTGTANAGIKDWLHQKTAPKTNEQVATPANATAAVSLATVAPLTAEQQACNTFLAEIRSGKVQPTKANQDKSNDCRKRVLANTQAASQSTAQAKDLPTVQVQGQRPAAKPDMGKTKEAAAKGCGFGSLIGTIAGVDPSLGCGVGAAIGGVFSYNKQLKEARQVEAAAKAAGAQATVTTQTKTDAKGKQHEAMDSLVITYKPADMEAQGADMTALLDKLARLTKGDKGGLVIRFDGANPVCQIPVQQLTQREALARHTVDNQCGKGGDYAITVSPIPDVR